MSDSPIFGTCDTGIQYTRRPGVYGIVLDQGKVVVIQKPDGALFLPGGGIEDGETVEEALIREIQEELGCAVTGMAFLASAQEYSPKSKDGRHYHFHNAFYRVEVDSASVKDSEADHMVRWMKMGEAIRGMQHLSHAWALEALNAKNE